MIFASDKKYIDELISVRELGVYHLSRDYSIFRRRRQSITSTINSCFLSIVAVRSADKTDDLILPQELHRADTIITVDQSTRLFLFHSHSITLYCRVRLCEYRIGIKERYKDRRDKSICELNVASRSSRSIPLLLFPTFSLYLPCFTWIISPLQPINL